MQRHYRVNYMDGTSCYYPDYTPGVPGIRDGSAHTIEPTSHPAIVFPSPPIRSFNLRSKAGPQTGQPGLPPERLRTNDLLASHGIALCNL